MIKDKIIEQLKKALEAVGIDEEKIDLEHPANEQFGDYSTNIALKIAKILKKNPMEVAEDIIKNFPKNDLIEKVEIMKPGFVNFWISDSYLNSIAQETAKNNISYPSFHLGNAKKVIVEFAHPNTLKLFHIGHLRNITTGESIVRIFETSGNKVVRANYEGDVGLHIAKCLWRIRQIMFKEGKDKLEKMNLRDKIAFIGKAYSEGNNAYETDEQLKKEIIEINKMIYEKNPEIMPLWKETRQWSLDYFDEIYKRVYSKFDRFYFESEMHEEGKKVAMEALKKGILEKSEGAIIFNGKKYGIDTRVFINSIGLPTYEGKELALAEKEFSEFGELDKTIHVVGPEQASFFKVTFKVEELLNPKKYKDKQYHLSYGWVKLKEGKMSSRQGNVIEGEWLLDEAKKKILSKFKSTNDIAEKLAVAAVKYSFLKNTVQSTIAFDFNESISLEGNSAPYLMYTYVRAQSVLGKSNGTTSNTINNISKEEKDLLRMFYQFPEVVKKAAQNFSPHLIATYLFDLAQKFNLFYQKCQILKADEEIKNFRLLLTQATAQVLKNGLYLLGIETVEKM